MIFEQSPEGREGISGEKTLQAEGTACTKALRMDCVLRNSQETGEAGEESARGRVGGDEDGEVTG